MRSYLKLWLLLPVCAALLAATQIWLSHLRYELSLDSQRVNAEQVKHEGESRKLRLEIASLIRPQRLRDYASRAGMAPPQPMQVIRP